MPESFNENLALQKQEYEKRKVKPASFPTRLDLPVSGKCNLRCIMCGIGVSPEKYDIHLTDKAYRHIYELFPYAKYLELNGAEIFAEAEGSRTDEVIARTLEFPQLKLGGATNGILLSEDRIKNIVAKFAEISFSLDSADPRVYESIRLGAEFKVIEDNLKRINALKTGLGLGPGDYPRLHFSATVMDRTYRGIPELVDFTGRIGGVFLTLRPLNKDITDDVWNKIVQEDIFSDKIKVSEYIKIIAEVKEIADKSGIRIADMAISKVRYNFPELLKPEAAATISVKPEQEYTICDLGWKSFYVSSQGGVVFNPCSRRIIGNLNTHSAKDIWVSKAAQDERKNLIKGNYANCISSRCCSRRLQPAPELQ